MVFAGVSEDDMAVTSNDEIRILTPSGMLGYGFPVDHFKMGLALKPHAITIDSGSTDSGPQKLGLGEMTCSREAYVKDIEVLLEAQHETKIPVLISSAGGDGTNLHVDVFRDIIAEIAKSAAGISSWPRSMPTSTRATSRASCAPAASSRWARCRRSTSARSTPPPSWWRRWAPSRSSRRSTRAKAST